MNVNKISKTEEREKDTDGRPVTSDSTVIARLRRLEISKGKLSRGNLLLRNTENEKCKTFFLI